MSTPPGRCLEHGAMGTPQWAWSHEHITGEMSAIFCNISLSAMMIARHHHSMRTPPWEHFNGYGAMDTPQWEMSGAHHHGSTSMDMEPWTHHHGHTTMGALQWAWNHGHITGEMSGAHHHGHTSMRCSASPWAHFNEVQRITMGIEPWAHHRGDVWSIDRGDVCNILQ